MSFYSFNAFQLKMIAITAMVVDHVGAVFFPDILIFRIIGRLTAPIMAFFVAEGYNKTHDVKKYELRLLFFALISMLPYKLVFGHSPFNIMFDLLLGLLIIDFSNRLKKDYQQWGLAFGVALIAFILETDGRLGISLMVYLFYRFRQDTKAITRAMGILYVAPAVIYALWILISRDASLFSQTGIWIRPLSLGALLLIFRYKGERGRSLKYFFYTFYPLHLTFIYILMVIL